MRGHVKSKNPCSRISRYFPGVLEQIPLSQKPGITMLHLALVVFCDAQRNVAKSQLTPVISRDSRAIRRPGGKVQRHFGHISVGLKFFFTERRQCHILDRGKMDKMWNWCQKIVMLQECKSKRRRIARHVDLIGSYLLRWLWVILREKCNVWSSICWNEILEYLTKDEKYFEALSAQLDEKLALLLPVYLETPKVKTTIEVEMPAFLDRVWTKGSRKDLVWNPFQILQKWVGIFRFQEMRYLCASRKGLNSYAMSHNHRSMLNWPLFVSFEKFERKERNIFLVQSDIAI